MNALVSIIMPAYNSRSYIAQSIESVINQTYKDWELIVVDDGSTDDTSKVVAYYCQQEPRIKYIYQNNGRQGKARNKGIAYSTGSYIAFLDSDDLWLPSKLAIQVQVLNSSNADLVFCDSYIFFDKLSGNDSVMNVERGYISGVEGIKKFLIANRIPILTVICKREAIISVDGFSEKGEIQNAEDYHLWLKLQIAGYVFLGIDYVLTAYREHPDSISNSDRSNYKQVIQAQFDIYQHIQGNRELVRSYMLKNMHNNLHRFTRYEAQEFYTSIQTCLEAHNKQYMKPVFYLFEKFNLRSLSLKSIYFVFNYL